MVAAPGSHEEARSLDVRAVTTDELADGDGRRRGVTAERETGSDVGLVAGEIAGERCAVVGSRGSGGGDQLTDLPAPDVGDR